MAFWSEINRRWSARPTSETRSGQVRVSVTSPSPDIDASMRAAPDTARIGACVPTEHALPGFERQPARDQVVGQPGGPLRADPAAAAPVTSSSGLPSIVTTVRTSAGTRAPGAMPGPPPITMPALVMGSAPNGLHDADLGHFRARAVPGSRSRGTKRADGGRDVFPGVGPRRMPAGWRP